MIPALLSRGFGYGSGVLSPDTDQFIVNIPKNASSYILQWSERHSWKSGLAQNHDGIKEMIVILRDPLQRWVSGISQYITTYIQSVHGPNGPVFDERINIKHDYFMSADMFIAQYNDLVERLFIDVASRFDDHVWPQSEILSELLPTVKRTYFFLDENLNVHLSKYLGFTEFSDLDRNQGTNNPEQKKIQEFFIGRLHARPELKQRLIKHYDKDYALINSVEFYGAK